MSETAEAIDRGLQWMLAMQNKDGGWGAFDRNNNREFLCHVPFADHNAMIDPSTPDLTGRVLESLAKLGLRVGDPAVDRAVAYVRRTQEADGSWFGRWGVNYIYGTWQAMVGLAAVGVPADDPLDRGRGQLAAEPSAGVRRLGRIAANLRAAAPARARAARPPRKRRGPCSGCWPPGLEDHPAVARGGPLPGRHARARRHVGRRRNSPARASRACSISATITTDLLPAAGPVAMGGESRSAGRRSSRRRRDEAGRRG